MIQAPRRCQSQETRIQCTIDGGIRPSATHLPPELLTEIIRILFNDLSPKNFSEWYRVECMELIKCSHVCRYWRDVILNAPILWSTLMVGDYFGPRCITQEARKRSHQALLKVFARPRSERDLELIRTELPRTQSLSYRRGSHPQIGLVHLPGDLDAPLLKTFSLSQTEVFADTVIPVIDPRCPLPVLGSVCMKEVPYTIASSLFRPALRSLELICCTDSGIGPTLPEFLLALQEMPLLETLKVLGQFKRYAPQEAAGALPTVQLKNLHHTYVDDDVIPTAYFLNHLQFPVSALLADGWIVCGFFYEERGVMPSQQAYSLMVTAILDKLAGRGLTGSPPSTTILKVIMGEPGSQDHNLNFEAGNHEGIFWRFYPDDFDVHPIVAFDALMVFPDTTFLAGITELSFMARRAFAWANARPTSPPRLTHRLANLQVLELQYAAGVWKWLVDLHVTELGQPKTPLPLPHLRVLKLTGGFWRDHRGTDFICMLFWMLKARNGADFPRLDPLGIYHAENFDEVTDGALLRPHVKTLELSDDMEFDKEDYFSDYSDDFDEANDSGYEGDDERVHGSSGVNASLQ